MPATGHIVGDMNTPAAKSVAEFFSHYPVRTFAKGEMLIHAGDQPASIFHIKSGRVKQYDISYRGDEIVLNVFSAPAFFPMNVAINHTPNDYFFEAESDVEVVAAPVDEVSSFIQAHPEVALDLLSRVYRGTDGLLKRLAHTMASSAKSRVMYELLIEARRFGTQQGEAVSVDLSESDIGARAGLARETVNREIGKLKQAGLLSITNHRITLTNIDALAEAIGPEL